MLGKERGDTHETGEIKRVVSSLLLQVDGLPSHVVTVAATNHPELLDRAVWRRFQVRLNLPEPGPNGIEEWTRRFERRTPIRFGELRAQVAQSLKDVSFSELEEFRSDIMRKYVLSLPSADQNHIYSITTRVLEASNISCNSD